MRLVASDNRRRCQSHARGSRVLQGQAAAGQQVGRLRSPSLAGQFAENLGQGGDVAVVPQVGLQSAAGLLAATRSFCFDFVVPLQALGLVRLLRSLGRRPSTGGAAADCWSHGYAGSSRLHFQFSTGCRSVRESELSKNSLHGWKKNEENVRSNRAAWQLDFFLEG